MLLNLRIGQINSPFDGEVISFQTRIMQLVLRVNKLEWRFLLHLGIDTVELNGKGFESQVQQGDCKTRSNINGDGFERN